MLYFKGMIYAFIGFKQVGKSTAAKYLEDKGYQRVNFKDALVAELKQNFPDLLRELSEVYDMSIGDLFEKKPAAMRALMQNYGTEVRRGDSDNYWTDKWTTNVCDLMQMVEGKPTADIVVDDVRFINEAEAVKRLGGKLIRIVRPDILSGGSHSSETEHLSIVVNYTIEGVLGDHRALDEQLDKILCTL